MKQALMKTFEKAVNRYLALDPESAHRLMALEGLVVTLTLQGLNISFQLVFMKEGIHLKHDDFLSADTVIQGSPLSLLRMALTQENRKQFFADDVSIEGNLDLGQQVIDLFDQLEIDWEEYTSRWIGDLPAHQLGRAVRSLKQFQRRARDILLRNMDEYLHEEADLFPSREALNDFFSDVDQVCLDADRLEARVQRLKNDGYIK